MGTAFKRFSIAGAILIGMLGSGCGSTAKFPNAPHPDEAVVVTAAITPGGITVSPSSFGAGLVRLVITNLTRNSQQVTLQAESSGASAGSIAPINPQDVGQLQADLTQGQYSLSVTDPSVPAATVAVGSTRPSPKDRLLEP